MDVSGWRCSLSDCFIRLKVCLLVTGQETKHYPSETCFRVRYTFSRQAYVRRVLYVQTTLVW
jgi:hypothetical protein